MTSRKGKRALASLFATFLVFGAVDAAAATLDIVAGALTYTAGAGINNALTISLAAGNYTFNDAAETITLGAGATGAGWAGSGTNTVTGTDASVTSIVVNTLDGNDSINVVSFSDPMTVNGGAGNDTLTVNGNVGLLDNLRYLPTALNAGQIINDNQPGTVTFTGVEFINLVLQSADGDGARVDGTIGNDLFQYFEGAVAGDATVQGTMDQNNATGGGPFALNLTTITGGNPVPNDIDVNFFNPGGSDTFEFNGTAGDDSIDVGVGEAGGVQVENTISAVVFSRIEVFNIASINVHSAAGNDTLTVNGTPGALDNLRYTPTALNAGTIINDSLAKPPIAFTGIEFVNLVLQPADGDGARIDGTIGNDLFRYFEGAVAGSGTVQGTMDQNNATGGGPFALSPTTITGGSPIANDIDFNFFVPGGTDTFEFDGTAGDDSIAVTVGEAGGVQVENTISAVVFSRIEVFNIANVNLLGAAGNDLFAILPSTTVPISVVGGAPVPPATPGDQLAVDQTGVTGPSLTYSVSATGFSGTYTFTNRASVTFSEIEGGILGPVVVSTPIPTLSQWALIALVLLLGFVAFRAHRGRI